MVVAQPGSILGQSELPIHLAPSNHSMSPERKGEEDCELEAPCEELEGDSVSSEGGRMTDSTDDEETSSTESSHARKEEEVGSQVQRRLEIEQLKVMGRISQLEQEIRDLQLQRRELNIEVEMELALLEGELRTERKKMEQEEELIGSLHGQLRETERRWQEEKEKGKLRLQDEKKKVQDLEQKISECRAQLDKQPESLREQLRKQIQEMMETMDTAVKSFEDLEFQQLETESSREEDREASYRQISQDISRQQNELNRRKDKVLQIRGAQDQAAADRRRISEENTKIFKSLNQEKERLLSLSALIGKDSEKQEKKEPRKGLQRTSSLPRRRGNSPFVRPTDRPVSLNGSTCLESLGITLNLAVSSNNTNGKAGQSVSPSLEKARSPDIQGEERRGSKEGKPQNGLGRLSGTYGPLPKIAEIERQLREAMAEKERLLKAREEKRAAKEMKTRRLEMDQSQAKEQLAITSPATAQPATAETAKEPVKVLSVPCSQTSVDLRAYLEASGHSVETCPQVRVSASCCRGYLVKMGGRIKTWKKRWFVFDRQKRRLAYYSDKEEQKLKGVIYFQAIEEVYYDHLRSAFKSPHPKLTFCLKTFERLFCMVAPTPEAMRIWMDVMVTAAEENSRY